MASYMDFRRAELYIGFQVKGLPKSRGLGLAGSELSANSLQGLGSRWA